MTYLICGPINRENKAVFAELPRDEKRIIQQCFVSCFSGLQSELVRLDLLLVSLIRR